MLTFLRRLKMSKKWIVMETLFALLFYFHDYSLSVSIRLVYEMVMLTCHLKKNYHSQTSRSWSAVWKTLSKYISLTALGQLH